MYNVGGRKTDRLTISNFLRHVGALIRRDDVERILVRIVVDKWMVGGGVRQDLSPQLLKARRRGLRQLVSFEAALRKDHDPVVGDVRVGREVEAPLVRHEELGSVGVPGLGSQQLGDGIGTLTFVVIRGHARAESLGLVVNAVGDEEGVERAQGHLEPADDCSESHFRRVVLFSLAWGG